MLVYLVLLYLSRTTTHAAPLSLAFRDNLDVPAPSDPSNCTCPDQRSVWDILWSCLATIFACSWVSVHPNMPGPNESRKKIILRRMELMFWAILTPEMVIYWAMRQWLGARRLACKWQGQGWTKTHGYFIQMGGFMLYQGEHPKGVLSPERLEEFFEKGKISFPTITGKEIQDRSKADALSKTLVIGQTFWFMLQCIARAVQRLEISQLELLTVALAFLNAFMYFFWWNKPLDVQTPVPVFLLDEPPKETYSDEAPKEVPSSDGFKPTPQSTTTEMASDPSSLSVSPLDQATDCGTVAPLAACDDVNAAASPVIPIPQTAPHSPAHSWVYRLLNPLRDIARYVDDCVSFAMTGIRKLVEERGYMGVMYTLFIGGPWAILRSISNRLDDLAESEGSRTIAEGQMHVSIFYALKIKKEDEINVLPPVSAIALAFGAIHCAGWALVFPSVTEAWIWRISSIAISIVPLLIIFIFSVDFWLRSFLDPSLQLRAERIELGTSTEVMLVRLCRLWKFHVIAMLSVYVITRILLLVESFISLRALAPGALVVIRWTSFLPHI